MTNQILSRNDHNQLHDFFASDVHSQWPLKNRWTHSLQLWPRLATTCHVDLAVHDILFVHGLLQSFATFIVVISMFQYTSKMENTIN